jgi:hypothetical protein
MQYPPPERICHNFQGNGELTAGVQRLPVSSGGASDVATSRIDSKATCLSLRHA